MRYVWICMDNKSAKMWGYTSFIDYHNQWEVIYFYGSIGRDMSFLNQTTKKYPNDYEAWKDVEAKIKDKQQKGYRRMLNSRYFEITSNYLIQLQEELDEPKSNVPLKMKEALEEALA